MGIELPIKGKEAKLTPDGPPKQHSVCLDSIESKVVKFNEEAP